MNQILNCKTKKTFFLVSRQGKNEIYIKNTVTKMRNKVCILKNK